MHAWLFQAYLDASHSAAITDLSLSMLKQLLRFSNRTLKEGQPFYTGATITNDGDARSECATLTYYVSRDRVINSSEMRLGTDRVSELNPGVWQRHYSPKEAPALKPGTWYLVPGMLQHAHRVYTEILIRKIIA
jgi:hypothetical protein